MQIPFIGVCLYLILYKTGLATIGVCIFYASASVGAFFISKNKNKKGDVLINY